MDKVDINKQFTYKDLIKLINIVEDKKEIHVNKQTYDEIIKELNFDPLELKVNNNIPIGEAIVIDKNKFDEMNKSIANSLILDKLFYYKTTI